MTFTADVVIVGSGAAGLTAALSASLAGAKVVLLEQSDKIGGTTAISGGGMWLPVNELDPDVPDSPAAVREYLDHLTGGSVAGELLDAYIEEAAQMPARLAAATPLTFLPEKGRPDYHAEYPGGATSSRTVFPDIHDPIGLGEWNDRLRRPHWPGGTPPVRPSEVAEALVSPDPSTLTKLADERVQQGIVGRGAALAAGLLEGCLKNGVDVRTNVRATELITTDGRVNGVNTITEDGPARFEATGGVVLAAGGFEWNRDLWSHLLSVPWEAPASPPLNRGDAFMMAARAGAKLARLDQVWGVPGRYLGEQDNGERVMRFGFFGSAAGEILVNRSGRRFTNEELNYHDIRVPMLQFDVTSYDLPNYPCYVVTDSRRLDALRAIDANRIDTVNDDAELTVVADTLEELARKLGVDSDGLVAQVNTWNANVEAGSDPEFGRQTTHWGRYLGQSHPQPLRSIDEAPFVGYRVRPSLFGTCGGAVINQAAEIVSMEGGAIPGLYGAGNAVASIFATAYPGGGATLGPAVTMGFIAGREAAAAAVTNAR